MWTPLQDNIKSGSECKFPFPCHFIKSHLDVQPEFTEDLLQGPAPLVREHEVRYRPALGEIYSIPRVEQK